MTNVEDTKKTTQSKPMQGKKHSVELQSIRGIAALVVTIHHCTFYYNYDAAAKRLAELTFNAHASVVVFFVLSGFVLAKALATDSLTAGGVFKFYIKRAFRIYPALWLAIPIAITYVFLFHGVQQPDIVSTWWPQSSRSIPDTAALIRAILGVGGFGYGGSLALPLWTLYVELAGSALLPFFVYLIIKRPHIFVFCLIGSLIFTFLFDNVVHLVPKYACCMILGVSLILVQNAFKAKRLSTTTVITISLLSFLTLWFGRHLVAQGYSIDYSNGRAVVIEAISAAVLIATIACYSQVFSCLRVQSVAKLGDISYSLYLFHLPMLAIVAGVWTEYFCALGTNADGLVSTLVVTVIVIAFSVMLSRYSYCYVELPLIRLGKTLTTGLGSGFVGRCLFRQ